MATNATTPPGVGDFDMTLSIITWARTQQPLVAAAIFCAANTISCSVLPIPVGVIMMVVAGVLYGFWMGMALYISTSLLGAYITLLITRLLRSRVLSLLGRHAATWRRLDEAITREGLLICFLWRVAPIAPYVLSSAMIAMTEISQFDYVWTTGLGIIPSSFPIISASSLAGTVLIEQKSVTPLTLALNVASIGAGILVMVRLGAIAMSVIGREGAEGEQGATPPATPSRSRSGVPLLL